MEKQSASKKQRKTKFFNLQEQNDAGMDNAYWVIKKKKGYQLSGNELGAIGGPESDIAASLGSDGIQYSGEYAQIQTNLSLEDLLEVFTMNSFDPLMNNLSTISINDVDIDAEQFKTAVSWFSTYWEKIKIAGLK
jgi:hypothetical protein